MVEGGAKYQLNTYKWLRTNNPTPCSQVITKIIQSDCFFFTFFGLIS